MFQDLKAIRLTAAFGAALSALALHADTHVIQCTVNEKTVASPKQMTVDVGDTLLFKGDFKAFPLRSMVIPEGAQKWNVSKGAEFRYVVRMPGKYGYWNEPAGSASGSASFFVEYPVLGPVRDDGLPQSLKITDLIQDATAEGLHYICFNVGQPQDVKFGLYNEADSQVATLFRGFKNPGRYCVPIPSKILAPGFYLGRLEGNVMDVKSFHMQRVKGRTADTAGVNRVQIVPPAKP